MDAKFRNPSANSLLIVDDLRDSQMILKRMLNALGYEKIEIVDSAEAALKLPQFDDGEGFDIILSDYNMGERMNGQQFLEELYARDLIGRQTLFLMATAETSREMVLGALECRPDDYIAKPFNQVTIEKKLNRLLKEKSLLKPVLEADAKGQREQAASQCKAIIDGQESPSIKLLRFYADLLLSYGELEKAHGAYDRCMPSNPPDWARYGMAQALHGLGQEEQAVEILESLVDTATTEMQVYDLLADIQLKRLAPSLAQKALEQGVSLSPNTYARQKVYSQLCLDNGDTDKAVRACKHVIKLGRFTSRASQVSMVELAQAQMVHAQQLNRPEDKRKIVAEANRHLKSALEGDNVDDWVRVSQFIGQAIEARENDQRPQADECIDKARQLINATVNYQEENFTITLGCIKGLLQLNEVKTANQIIRKLGVVYENQEAAINRIDRVSSEPISAQGRARLAKINSEGAALYKSRDYKGSMKIFNQGIEVFPNCLEFHLNYVMSALGHFGEYPDDMEIKDICRQRLDFVSSIDSERHHAERVTKMRGRLN
ncbi:response regulator [Oceanicoccus sp. KOV_DT_Chl]|uniref:response regulator n=1 Tax=Oceanicoccus sp. KOV_DT_Chl TaxID=1904639 RepID=UPI000C7C036B|nr:response regulator [Oceanicoccus sp. KOV_DT_Chl]